MTCPHHRSYAVCRSASIPLMLHILSTVVLGTCSCHLMCAITSITTTSITTTTTSTTNKLLLWQLQLHYLTSSVRASGKPTMDCCITDLSNRSRTSAVVGCFHSESPNVFFNVCCSRHFSPHTYGLVTHMVSKHIYHTVLMQRCLSLQDSWLACTDISSWSKPKVWDSIG